MGTICAASFSEYCTPRRSATLRTRARSMGAAFLLPASLPRKSAAALTCWASAVRTA